MSEHGDPPPPSAAPSVSPPPLPLPRSPRIRLSSRVRDWMEDEQDGEVEPQGSVSSRPLPGALSALQTFSALSSPTLTAAASAAAASSSRTAQSDVRSSFLSSFRNSLAASGDAASPLPPPPPAVSERVVERIDLTASASPLSPVAAQRAPSPSAVTFPSRTDASFSLGQSPPLYSSWLLTAPASSASPAPASGRYSPSPLFAAGSMPSRSPRAAVRSFVSQTLRRAADERERDRDLAMVADVALLDSAPSQPSAHPSASSSPSPSAAMAPVTSPPLSYSFYVPDTSHASPPAHPSAHHSRLPLPSSSDRHSRRGEPVRGQDTVDLPLPRFLRHSIRPSFSSFHNVSGVPASISASSATAAAATSSNPSAAPSSASASSAVSLELGYDPTLFVEPAAESKELEELTCVICSCVVRDPLNLPCGDLFCRACLERAHSHRRVCPSCKQPFVLSECQPNYTIIKKVWSFKVRCPKHVDGCTAEYVIGVNDRNVAAHASKCSFVSVQCAFCAESMPKHRLDAHINGSVGAHLLLLHDRTKAQADELSALQKLTAEMRRSSDRAETKARAAIEATKEEFKRAVRKEQKKYEERIRARMRLQSDSLLSVLRKISAAPDGFFLYTFTDVDASASSNDSLWYSSTFVVRGREHCLRLVKAVQADDIVTMDGESIARHVLTLSLLYIGRAGDDLADLLDKDDEAKKQEGREAAVSGPPAASAALLQRPSSESRAPLGQRRYPWEPLQFSPPSPLAESGAARGSRPSAIDAHSSGRRDVDALWLREPARPRLVRFDEHDVDIIAELAVPPPDSSVPGGAAASSSSQRALPVDNGADDGQWMWPDTPPPDEEHERARVRFFVYGSQRSGDGDPGTSQASPSDSFSSRSPSLPHVIYSSSAVLTYHTVPHSFASWDSVPYISRVQTDDVPVADSEGDGGRGWIDLERKTVTAAVMVDDFEVDAGSKGAPRATAVGRGDFLLASQQFLLSRGREYEDGERGAVAGVGVGAHRHGMMEGMSAEAKQMQQSMGALNSKRRRMDD